MKKYRDTGAQGALLDEYEKANDELIDLIKTISHKELITIVDTKTKDDDCRSIQTILSHIIRAGYTYVTAIRKHEGDELDYMPNVIFNNSDEYIQGLKFMFNANVKMFKDHPNLQLEEMDNFKKIKARWGQSYDPEQLLEHAIVHILRHRRQIERFLVKLRD